MSLEQQMETNLSADASGAGGPIDFEQHAAFTREIYEKSYLPAYEQLALTPRRLLRVPVVLPFQLPFPEAATFTFLLGDSEACTLSFDTLTSRHPIRADLATPPTKDTSAPPTRVVMTYVTECETEIGQSEVEATRVFDLMVAKLNQMISAYLVVTKDCTVYHVGHGMFEFGSVVAVIDPADWRTLSYGLFLLHANTRVAKPVLDQETLGQVAWFVEVIEQGLNPFILSEEMALMADREFLGGCYREAVIYAQSSVEVFLSTLLTKILEIEGASPESIERMLQDVGFATRLRREYHPRLGGSWDVNNAASPLGRWYTNTYQLRNRVVHGGYAPTQHETKTAVEAAGALRNHIIGLIHQVRAEFRDLRNYFESPAQ